MVSWDFWVLVLFLYLDGIVGTILGSWSSLGVLWSRGNPQLCPWRLNRNVPHKISGKRGGMWFVF